MNTEFRKNAKDFSKLTNNAGFEKPMENVRKHGEKMQKTFPN